MASRLTPLSLPDVKSPLGDEEGSDSSSLLDFDMEKGESSDSEDRADMPRHDVRPASPKRSGVQHFVDLLWMGLNVLSTVLIVFLNKTYAPFPAAALVCTHTTSDRQTNPVVSLQRLLRPSTSRVPNLRGDMALYGDDDSTLPLDMPALPCL